MSTPTPKNGKTHAAPAAAKGEKKTKEKKPFTALLNLRLDKIEANAKRLERMYIRAGKGTTSLQGILAGLTSARSDVSDLPADFKPARAAVGVQPMAEGTKVEIVAKARVKFEGLVNADAAKGLWTVTRALPTSMAATSDVTGDKCVFARRDVQLPGVERKPRAKKAKKTEGAAQAQA